MEIMNRIALLCPMEIMDKRERIPDGVQLFVYSAEYAVQELWQEVKHIAKGAFALDGWILSCEKESKERAWEPDELLLGAATQVWRVTDEVGVHIPANPMRVYGTRAHVLPHPHVGTTALRAVLTGHHQHMIEDPLFECLGFKIIKGVSLTEVLNTLMPEERAYNIEEVGLAV